MAYRWAEGLHHARIALVNTFLQYPFYGQDLTNSVQYLAVRHGNGVSEPIRSCRAWRRAIDDGRYRYVVVASPGFPVPNDRTPPEELWTRSDPGARLVLQDTAPHAHEWVFQVRKALSPGLCGSTR